MFKRLEPILMYKEKLREMGLLRLQRKKTKENVVTVCKYLMGTVKKKETDSTK